MGRGLYIYIYIYIYIYVCVCVCVYICTVELVYNVMKGTNIFFVVIKEEHNVMINSVELIGSRENVTF